MAHEKVYGICEDKCREEVIPKEKLYTYSGTVTAAAGRSSYLYMDDTELVNKFNINNTIILATNVKVASGRGCAVPSSEDFSVELMATSQGLAAVVKNLTGKEMQTFYVTVMRTD